jgi:hypothetical protein
MYCVHTTTVSSCELIDKQNARATLAHTHCKPQPVFLLADSAFGISNLSQFSTHFMLSIYSDACNYQVLSAYMQCAKHETQWHNLSVDDFSYLYYAVIKGRNVNTGRTGDPPHQILEEGCQWETSPPDFSLKLTKMTDEKE